MYKPEPAFELWALGWGDIYCAADKDLPIPRVRRLLWNIRGKALMFLFGWWWWKREDA